MNAILETQNLTLEPYDSRRLANLCGQFDEHLRQIESQLQVEIRSRGNLFQMTGEAGAVRVAEKILSYLYDETENGKALTPDFIHLAIREASNEAAAQSSNAKPKLKSIETDEDSEASLLTIKTRRTQIKPRGDNQQQYIRNILQNDINFGIGPAGTGKTYLAVAAAVAALDSEQVRRIILVRPAVEAGEKLGFLPGDLSDKINPYLRPLYDALYEMLGFDRVIKLIDRHVIEVAPLAYMRGRTLNHSFIILDESQNTTREQMKMFLTRIGFGSKAVITGDHTQVDLPRGTESGLRHVMRVLDGIDGIGFTYFASKDVVRHTLVQKIVEAYDADDKLIERNKKEQAQKRTANSENKDANNRDSKEEGR